VSSASENQPEVPETKDESPAEPEDTGPDLSALNDQGLAVLQASLDVLRDFQPEPGTLNDLPQVTIDRAHTERVCRLIKDDPRIGAKMLLCLSCVDYSDYFQLVYVLQSLEPERTLVLKTEIPYDDATVPSVTSVWRAADWYEREAHDLFGVSFSGHPDLAPLLLYEGFEGYPGRKEYPFYEYQEF
jgi:NADH-quinone oxidoreductase subunit C